MAENMIACNTCGVVVDCDLRGRPPTPRCSRYQTESANTSAPSLLRTLAEGHKKLRLFVDEVKVDFYQMTGMSLLIPTLHNNALIAETTYSHHATDWGAVIAAVQEIGIDKNLADHFFPLLISMSSPPSKSDKIDTKKAVNVKYTAMDGRARSLTVHNIDVLSLEQAETEIARLITLAEETKLNSEQPSQQPSEQEQKP